MSQRDFRPAFGQLRSSIRGLYRRYGVSRLVVLASAWALGGLSLDYFLHLPWLLRAMSLGAALFALVHVLRRHLLYPLSRPITDDDIALALEHQNPRLADRLISAVQLERALPGIEHPQTRDMAAAVIAKAREEAATLDVHAVLEPRQANRQRLAAAILAASFLVCAFTVPDLTGIWAQRNILLLNAAWPQRVYLKLTTPSDPGDPERSVFTVAQGRDVDVMVVAEERGEIPPSVWIHYTSPSIGSSRRSAVVGDSVDGAGRMIRQGMASTEARPRDFGFTFHNVREDVVFYVTGGDDRTRTIEIRTLVPPTLYDPAVTLDFPAYTKLPRVEQASGDIKAPVGTTVQFTASTNKPIKSGELLVTDADPAREQKVLLAVAPDQLSIRGEFEVRGSSTYSISLISTEDMVNDRAAAYQISARPDLPPRVRVEKPGRSLQATAVAAIPLQGTTTDDFGITGVMLRQWLGGIAVTGDDVEEGGETVAVEADGDGAREEIVLAYTDQSTLPEGVAPSTSRLLDPLGGKQVSFTHLIELGGIQVPQRSASGEVTYRPLRPGDRILYQVAARDIGPGQEGVSPQYEITIVTAKHLDRELAGQIKDIQDRLKRMRTEAERIETSLAEQTGGDAAARTGANASAAEARQGRLSRETRWVEERLTDVRDTKDRNRITTPEEVQSLDSLIGGAAAARAQSASVEEALHDAVVAREDRERKQSLDSARDGELSLIGQLGDLIKQLAQYEDFQSIVIYFRNIREEQDAILQRAREQIAPGDGSPRQDPPRSPSPGASDE